MVETKKRKSVSYSCSALKRQSLLATDFIILKQLIKFLLYFLVKGKCKIRAMKHRIKHFFI